MIVACLSGTTVVSGVAQTPSIHMTFSGDRNHNVSGSAMDPDMALGIGLGLDDTMVPGGSVDHPHQPLPHHLCYLSPQHVGSSGSHFSVPQYSPFTFAASLPASPG